MPEYCTIYVADPSLLSSRLFNQFQQITSYEGMSHDESAAGLILTLPNALIHMNFMPPDQIQEHLRGMAGWVQKVQTDTDQLLYVLARIRGVRLPMGCVIEPGFDASGEVQQFIFGFNDRLNGLLFWHDTIFDFDGQPLAGQFYDL